ncbi:site-specific integrase [Massilia sp. B-10]|nr:site-specific integrase [Massilia sp. B-10]
MELSIVCWRCCVLYFVGLRLIGSGLVRSLRFDCCVKLRAAFDTCLRRKLIGFLGSCRRTSLIWLRSHCPLVCARRTSLGFQWSQVDLARGFAWIHPDQSKTRKAIAVPLNADAMRVLTLQLGKHAAHVFTFKGEKVSQVSTAAWYKALKRASIENFRWHDLRHTWASWHVQNGTPLHVLQELGGWESEAMVRRYAHLSASHLAIGCHEVADVDRGRRLMKKW